MFSHVLLVNQIQLDGIIMGVESQSLIKFHNNLECIFHRAITNSFNLWLSIVLHANSTVILLLFCLLPLVFPLRESCWEAFERTRLFHQHCIRPSSCIYR